MYSHCRINNIGYRDEFLWNRDSYLASSYFTIPPNLITAPLDFQPVQVKKKMKVNIVKKGKNK